MLRRLFSFVALIGCLKVQARDAAAPLWAEGYLSLTAMHFKIPLDEILSLRQIEVVIAKSNLQNTDRNRLEVLIRQARERLNPSNILGAQCDGKNFERLLIGANGLYIPANGNYYFEFKESPQPSCLAYPIRRISIAPLTQKDQMILEFDHLLRVKATCFHVDNKPLIGLSTATERKIRCELENKWGYVEFQLDF